MAELCHVLLLFLFLINSLCEIYDFYTTLLLCSLPWKLIKTPATFTLLNLNLQSEFQIVVWDLLFSTLGTQAKLTIGRYRKVLQKEAGEYLEFENFKGTAELGIWKKMYLKKKESEINKRKYTRTAEIGLQSKRVFLCVYSVYVTERETDTHQYLLSYLSIGFNGCAYCLQLIKTWHTILLYSTLRNTISTDFKLMAFQRAVCSIFFPEFYSCSQGFSAFH